MPRELTEEEIFADDKDPLEAIAAIRREEGASEEDLEELTAEIPASDKSPAEPEDDLDTLLPDDPAEPTADEDDPKDPKAEPAADEEPAPGDKPVDEPKGEEEKETEPEKEKEEVSEEPKVKNHKFTANGKEYEFTEAEMLEQFGTVFAQAVDYTQKTQKIAPYRKMISALESEGIDTDQLNLAIDALKGNKQAIQALMEKNEIDPLDFTPGDNTNPYQPTNYGKDETQINLDDVVSRISTDTEYKITVDVVDNQWDDKSRVMLSNNPQLIEGLHNDIKTGVYDKVAPAAMKMKVLDGNAKSDIEYYMLAGQQVLGDNQASKEQPAKDPKPPAQDVGEDFDQASSDAAKKRAASTTRGRADRKGVIDYLDDDDEKFDDWYKNLMSSN